MINYLADAQIGGKIDLSKFEKTKKDPIPETYLPFLKEALARQSLEVNKDFVNFLDSEGKIRLEGSSAESDQSLVLAQEDGFSRGMNKDIETWRRDTEKNAANITEMSLTVMLNKFLKENFIVARASSYDDYNNGVDQVLVDKFSGEVICGFDEVISNTGDDGLSKKINKFKNRERGIGTNIKYGAKMQDGKLIRSEVKNVPAFCMSLRKVELGELLESLKNNPEKTTEVEEKIFAKLLDSLETQIFELDLNEALLIKTKIALEKLRTSI